MDFIKNKIEQEGQEALLKNVAGQFLNNAGSDNKKEETRESVETKTDNRGNTEVTASKYSTYVDQGVKYAEKNVLHIDTSNMTDSQKKVETTVETFINKQVDNYTK